MGDELFILGGCTGGDIRRDGEDCRDVWCADLSKVDAVEGELLACLPASLSASLPASLPASLLLRLRCSLARRCRRHVQLAYPWSHPGGELGPGDNSCCLRGQDRLVWWQHQQHAGGRGH